MRKVTYIIFSLLFMLSLYLGVMPATPAAAAPTVLFDGTVTLTKDAIFSQVAYNSGNYTTVEEDTPLVALHATGLTYDVTDKMNNGVLLLDNVDGYLRKTPNYWNAYVNDVYKDGYASSDQALNLMEIVDGDKVEFYYAPNTIDPNDLTAVKAAATAAVLTVADIVPSDYPAAQFSATPVAGDAPLTVVFTDASTGAATLTYEWDFNNDGIVDSTDQNPSYAYTTGGFYTVKLTVTNLLGSDSEVRTNYITVIDATTNWSLELSGARDDTVTKAFFESGLACPTSGHQVFWTDADGNAWGGVPLWLLVGMVDDDPDVGPLHFNFNDAIAAQNYQVKVIGSDGWSAVFDSTAIARSDDYLVANTLNGNPLPWTTTSGKPSWPLHLKGSAVLGGQQVGGIARIELSNLPELPAGWTLAMLGEVGDTITQEEFEDGLACAASGHYIEWTDFSGKVWSGVPLWVLLGTVDDIELANHWTFNDAVAATGYTVKVIASDGFNKTFSGSTLARNDNYIIANEMNGAPLGDSAFPLRLVGSGVTKPDGTLGGSAVGKIAKIEILELQTPPAAEGSYNLALKGRITDVLSQAEIEQGLACPASGHLVTWTQQIKDASGNVIETHEWSGIPLWFLAGWVDDRVPHDFNSVQAAAGYKITVKASDGYAKDFASADIAYSDSYIVANMKDGALLTSNWPLQLVGSPLTKADGSLSGKSVGKIAEIELTEFGVPVEAPMLHIVKYDADGTTVVAEATIDYAQMMSQFDIIGDGVTQYKFQGVTMDPTDLWAQYDETKGGYKISNAVKGTRLVDLVGLVGDMGQGTDLVLVASDGYKTTLPYTSIHMTTDIQARQGDAILAWYADGKFVPGYSDGMRLFFMPADHIYGQWDMHETMPAGYWHYYYQSYDPSDPDYGQYAPGILYPSCAGLSAKYVTEIRVYTTAEPTWNLQLDGTRVGGLTYTVAKPFFEAALACQMGANHEATYTDTKTPPNTWLGMPLWFLAGFVDDADQHSNNAYNQALAEAGYDITIIGSGGFTKVFDSVPTIRSNDYIVCNTKNGVHIAATDAQNWPLKLMGAGVASSGKLQVGGINTIILNLRPKIDSLTVPIVRVGTDATALAFFTDPYDTHTAVFDWGDGSTSAGVVDEITHSITGSHAYAMNGFYTVKVTLTDSMGVMATKTATDYLVVYDPNIGTVSGSGTIKFAAGEFTLKPEAAGKATFSLTAKYNNGVPSGNVKLVLDAAKSQFTSASIDYVVILDGTAYIHGMGSIDKSAPDYEFLLVVKDGGKQGSDTYRLQVWDLSMNKVFDNAPEAGDMLNPDASPITGGSIVIKMN